MDETVNLYKLKPEIAVWNEIYKAMNQCNDDIKNINKANMNGKIVKIINGTVQSNAEIIKSLKKVSDILKDIIQEYENTENRITKNNINAKATNKAKSDGGGNEKTPLEKAREAYDKIEELIKEFQRRVMDANDKVVDQTSLVMNFMSILQYIGKDPDAMDDFLKIVGKERGIKFIESANAFAKADKIDFFGKESMDLFEKIFDEKTVTTLKEVGVSELGSVLSLFSRSYENSAAIMDGDIRWDQGVRYFGLEVLGDLGKDVVIGYTGVYGFTGFAVADAICISNTGDDFVAWLAHTIDDNTYEKWYQSW